MADMPSKGQARTLDALMTACVDHGVTPAAIDYASDYASNMRSDIAFWKHWIDRLGISQ